MNRYVTEAHKKAGSGNRRCNEPGSTLAVGSDGTGSAFRHSIREVLMHKIMALGLATFALSIGLPLSTSASAATGAAVKEACDHMNKNKAGSCKIETVSRQVLAGCAGGVCFECPVDVLVLRVMQAREQETNREVSRARISQSTIRRLCGRSQIGGDFLVEIQEILLAAGWCFFLVGPSYFAIIKVKSVEGWGRISSKRIADELKSVPRGQFNFENLEPLLLAERNPAEEEEKDD
jgi:hypothetical protein